MAELEKTLSFPVILLITINSIMGTGIFFLPALGAATAGPSSILAWLGMAVIAMFMSFVFAELSSMFPFSGGVYEYCKQAFGAFPSFIIGWITLIVGNVTIAMLVVGAIRYLNPNLPVILSIGFSLIFIFLFNFLAFRGLQTSAVMLVAFAIITLVSVLGLAIPGLFSFQIANVKPFFTHPPSTILLTVFLIAETFFGWETATFLAEETKDAKHVIPKALIIGTALICLIVLLFVIVSIGLAGAPALGASATPLALLGAMIYGAASKPVFSILVYVSIIGSVAGWIVSAPRLIMALAKDKMFIESMAQVHPKYNTPYKAILFQTILTSILVVVGSGQYELLLHLLVPLVLVMYAAVVFALIVLRKSQPTTERPFKMWGAVPISWALIALLLGLVSFWAFTDPTAVGTLRFAISLVILGLPVYIMLKYTYDPEAIMGSAQLTGRLSVLLEDFLLPRSRRKDFLGLLTLPNKRVLEYGGNVGTLTMHLADEVGPYGKVFSTELSEQNAKIIASRMEKKGHKHVRVLHDIHHVSRIHPDVEDIDMVVSIGSFSYIQNLRQVLRDIKDRMPINGVVLFVEYVDFFKILPNAGIIANLPELKQIFLEEGFAVTITKQKGFLWNYLLIHGIRTDKKVPFV